MERVVCLHNTIMGPEASWKSSTHTRDDKALFGPENNKTHAETNKILRIMKT